MANNVIGLFENESVAESVVEELLSSGFRSSTIKRFQGNNDQLEDELRREGIPADEASYYVNGLSEGGALVSVRAEENETDSAVDIMNRYVNTAQSGADAESAALGSSATESSDASYRGSDAGWDDDSKGVGADGADYDGVGGGVGSAAGGAAVGRAAYEAYNKQKQASLGSSQGASTAQTSSPMGFPVGREAYDSYTRQRPAAPESDTSWDKGNNASASGSSLMGFPVGREAYAAYSKERGTASGSAIDGEASEGFDSSSESGVSSSGVAVGRQAYEAYNREKASKWNK